MGAGSATPVVSSTTRSKAGISPRVRRERRSRSSSARSPRIAQHTQPFARRTVRSSTCRRRWWSIPTSPSSLTSTAVSPRSGWRRRLARSVVLPLPRNPVSTVTGSLLAMAEAGDEAGIERIEAPSRQALGLSPEGSEVGDDGRAALAVAEDVDAAAPVSELEPEVGQDAVQEADAQ